MPGNMPNQLETLLLNFLQGEVGDEFAVVLQISQDIGVLGIFVFLLDATQYKSGKAPMKGQIHARSIANNVLCYHP